MTKRKSVIKFRNELIRICDLMKFEAKIMVITYCLLDVDCLTIFLIIMSEGPSDTLMADSSNSLIKESLSSFCRRLIALLFFCSLPPMSSKFLEESFYRAVGINLISPLPWLGFTELCVSSRLSLLCLFNNLCSMV